MRDFHVDVMERLRPVRVSEVDIYQLESAFEVRDIQLAARFYLLVSIQNLKVAFGISQSIVHLVIDSVKLPDGC
jgi:hypothetical protein